MVFSGDKFNVNIMFDIRGQHEFLKVKVTWVSKITLGAEPRTFMTHVLTINEILLHYTHFIEASVGQR